MHSFEVHSNESACRKSGRLGLEQVWIKRYLHLEENHPPCPEKEQRPPCWNQINSYHLIQGQIKRW